jgi:hypothetical protein
MSATATQDEKGQQDKRQAQERSGAAASKESKKAPPSRSSTAGKRTNDKSKDAKAKSGQGKAKRAPSSGPGGSAPRLRPGELDGLVLGHMREHGSGLPITAGKIAKAIDRSAGAVGNCLERLEKSNEVRRVEDKPKKYDLPAGK